MKSALFVVTLGISVVFSSIASLGQLTVDATGPIRQRRREPVRGSGGSVGRKLPLGVRIEANGSSPDADGKILVTFILTNSGKDDLPIPLSPHPEDFEPEDSKVSYVVRVLSLYMTLDRGEGANRRRAMLPGNAHLYGNSDFPGTMVSLAPGESIHVLTRLSLPTDAEVKEGGGRFVGHASLANQMVKTVRGQTLSDAQEIGSASSPELTLESLLKSPY